MRRAPASCRALGKKPVPARGENRANAAGANGLRQKLFPRFRPTSADPLKDHVEVGVAEHAIENEGQGAGANERFPRPEEVRKREVDSPSSARVEALEVNQSLAVVVHFPQSQSASLTSQP